MLVDDTLDEVELVADVDEGVDIDVVEDDGAVED